MAEFVADCRARNLSPRTVEFYLEGLTSFRAFAGGGERVLTLGDLRLVTARLWLADLVGGNRRPATVAARARALRTFSSWVVHEDYTRSDPLDLLRMPLVPRTVIATFSPEQARVLIEASAQPLSLTLRILLDTGLRLGEVTSLRLSDIGDGQLRVSGKGGHARTVPYGRTLDTALRRYLSRERPAGLDEPEDPLLIGRDERALTGAAIYQAMRRLGRELAFGGVRTSPHTCRHTFAVTFLRNGGNVFALQKILGHTDLAMVRRYAELTDEDVTAEHRHASPLDHLYGMPRRQHGARTASQAARFRRNGAKRSSGESR